MSLNMTLLFLFVLAMSFNLQAIAFDVKQADKKLTDMLQNISKLSQNQADDFEKLQAKNTEMFNYLKRSAAEPQMMSAPLKDACNNGLTALVSDDKKMRCYSWDTLTGGTMHFFYSLIAYDTGNKQIKCLLINPTSGNEEGEGGPGFEGVDTIKTTDGKTVYLVRDLFIGSGMIHGRTLYAYTIAGGKLKRFSFFKTTKKMLDSISFDFAEYTDGTEFVLSTDKKSLRVPLIKPAASDSPGSGTATGKYLNYVFNGTCFVFKK